MKWTTTIFSSLLISFSSTYAATIQRGLTESIQLENKDIIVSFNGIDSALLLPSLNGITSRSRKASIVSFSLQENAKTAQQSTIDLLQSKFNDIELSSLWISNTLHITGATHEVLEVLKEHEDAYHVREAVKIKLGQRPTGTSIETLKDEIQWGIQKVGAPDVWASGCQGEGVVVGTIDSGVRVTHDALKNNFRKNKAWYDPYENKTIPVDEDGHGTHTMGTICGGNGIGVAPKAEWIACRGCKGESCEEKELLQCAEFMACPHSYDKSDKTCGPLPHVVSNSWGGSSNDPFYQAAVDTWRKVGIIPVFANGNEGPSCSTTGSPADYHNVISVGSSTVKNTMSSFSSRGPTKDGSIKPDITAPGSAVLSCAIDSDKNYVEMSGTSMATPHVAGVIALLFCKAKKTLTYDQVYQLLTDTAETNINSKDSCTTVKKGKQNNLYGYGLINAPKICSAYLNPQPVTTATYPTTTATYPTTTATYPTTTATYPTTTSKRTKTPRPTRTKRPSPTTTKRRRRKPRSADEDTLVDENTIVDESED